METLQEIIAQFNKEKNIDKKTHSQELTVSSAKAMQKWQEDRKKLLMDYNPTVQREICSNRDLCFFGKFPTLAKINSTYGTQMSVAWLIPQLMDLSEFCGSKEKLFGDKLEECAWLIAQNYFYLKISELMLFFNRFKQGKYGHFYGSVDPLVIMTALQDFLRERGDAIFDHKSELNLRRIEAQEGEGITYNEYLRRKQLRENNQTK